MRASYIYGLADPGSEEIRYVGQSVHPERRFTQHLWHSRGVLGLWIKELALWDIRPSLIVFGYFPIDSIVEQERIFIERFQSNDLLNRKPPSRTGYRDGPSGHEIECIATGERFPGYAAAGRASNCSLQTVKNHCIDSGMPITDPRFKRITL